VHRVRTCRAGKQTRGLLAHVLLRSDENARAFLRGFGYSVDTSNAGGDAMGARELSIAADLHAGKSPDSEKCCQGVRFHIPCEHDKHRTARGRYQQVSICTGRLHLTRRWVGQSESDRNTDSSAMGIRVRQRPVRPIIGLAGLGLVVIHVAAAAGGCRPPGVDRRIKIGRTQQ
jgi:hypothetical protein